MGEMGGGVLTLGSRGRYGSGNIIVRARKKCKSECIENPILVQNPRKKLP